ncbi:hypothetical protein Zm00014a_010136 [Zea mays]|jgi:hypothetical protein|uniref:Uncharacterized protein n=2 Tax=Zea mays TaxID=4577 RepID=K7U200_MAIZE|nr:uncharacterized protein LOC100276969 [Zea mays]AQK42329.1 hypothetical protein ZEAMMB73_Zm00001d024926 [Zea mays]PWZ46118.1 hypothetical protein Zm00014a_010136 [Zea mays]|eukprot:NP_001144126.2 uncharacterized protein LOC100276969 [Zea mays]
MASNDNVAVASEVSNAVTKLNYHLATALTGSGSGSENAATTVVTLAGKNSGATMEAAAAGDVEDLVVVGSADAEEHDEGHGQDDEEVVVEENVVITAYANSNYQAVNNSVLVAGSCAVDDPGVHVVVVEHVDEIRDYDEDIDGQEF